MVAYSLPTVAGIKQSDHDLSAMRQHICHTFAFAPIVVSGKPFSFPHSDT
jgi:hypothetical protein